MYNEAIVTSPVALFLGAGASKPFEKKLMGEFIDHLAQPGRLGQEPLFNEIIDSKDGRDLEHLFEELDEWSRKQNYKAASLTRDGMGFHLMGLSPSNLSEAAPSGAEIATVAREADRLLDKLRQATFNEYRSIEHKWKQPLVDTFEPIFTTILQHVSPAKHPIVVVFTTNYDPAIETFCEEKAAEYRLCDGFVPQPNGAGQVWRAESIDTLDLKTDPRKHIALFKLHGSTSWYDMANGFVKSPAPIYTAGSDGIKNLLIYPAKRKVALDNPYFTAYDYFQRTLERQGPVYNSKLCIVIGYSFRDYDALSRLRSAAAYNPTLKLLVIDPRARPLCAYLELLGVKGEVVPTSFGSRNADGDSHSQSLPRKIDYIEKITMALDNLASLDSSHPLDDSGSFDPLGTSLP